MHGKHLFRLQLAYQFENQLPARKAPPAGCLSKHALRKTANPSLLIVIRIFGAMIGKAVKPDQVLADSNPRTDGIN